MARILICEDEEKICNLMVRQLEDAGHEVVVSKDGQEGFRQVLWERVDLVVTDIIMPGWSGHDLAACLEFIGRETRILVVTGYVNHESTDLIRNLPHVVGILPKPWRKAELLAAAGGLADETLNLANSTHHIFILDDDPNITGVWSKVLRAVGYQVTVFTDSIEGMGWYSVHSREVDLVILDVMMPGLNGNDCLSSIRLINADVPVVVATGYADSEVMSSMKEKGVQVVLDNPFEAAACLGQLARILS